MKIGLDAVFTIILAALKITGVLNISWLWVFMPMIVSTAILRILLVITGAVAVFMAKSGKLTIKNRGEF